MAHKHTVPRSPAHLVIHQHFKAAIKRNIALECGVFEGLSSIALSIHALCTGHEDAYNGMWDALIESLESAPSYREGYRAGVHIWHLESATIVKAILDGVEDPLPNIAVEFRVNRSTASRWCDKAMDELLKKLCIILDFALTQCHLDTYVEKLRVLFPHLL